MVSDLSNITNVGTLWLKYDKLVENEKFEDAILYLKRILEISPNNVEALSELASSYRNLDLFKLAIKYEEKALKLDPYNADRLFIIGYYYSLINDQESEIDYYKRALLEDPNNIKALNNLTTVYIELEEYEEAIALLEKAMTSNPSNHLIWYNLGRVYNSRKDFSKAVDCFLKSISIDPNDPYTWANLGRSYEGMDNDENALRAYKKAVILKPSLDVIWNDIGLIYHNRSDFSLAIECFHQAIEIKWDNAVSWGRLGDVHYDINEYSSAIACYREALKIDPKYKRILKNLEITLKDNDYKEEPVDLVALIQKTKSSRKILLEKWRNEKIEPTERMDDFRKLLKRFTKIAVKEMVELLEFQNVIELKRWLMELPEDISIKVDDEYVTFQQKLTDGMVETIVSSFSKYQIYTCKNCGFPIEKDTKTCPDCGMDIVYCVVCKLPISFGDDTITCPNCEAVGHYDHFSEWIKINGSCPQCKEKLKL
ncbi:MAG: tetratricopeptide repeat protein [Candidatus Heimdallarchaeota archaeon]